MYCVCFVLGPIDSGGVRRQPHMFWRLLQHGEAHGVSGTTSVATAIVLDRKEPSHQVFKGR